MNGSSLACLAALAALSYALLPPKAAKALLAVPWISRANVRRNLARAFADERLARLAVGLGGFALFGSALAFTWPQARAAVNWPGPFALTVFMALHAALAAAGASLAFDILNLRLSRAAGFLFFGIWCGLVHPLFLGFMQAGALSGPAGAGWVERLGAADPTLSLAVIALPASFAAAACSMLGRKARPNEKPLLRLVLGWSGAGLLLRMAGGAQPLACLGGLLAALVAALAGRLVYRLARDRGMRLSRAEAQAVLMAVLPAAVASSGTLSPTASAGLSLACLGLATVCQAFFVRVLRVADERVMTAAVFALSAGLGVLAAGLAGGYEGHAAAREMIFGLSLLALPLAQAVAVSAVMALGLGLGLASGFGLGLLQAGRQKPPTRAAGPEPRKGRSQRLPGRPRAR